MRWLLALVVVAAVYGLGAVWWRVMTGESWADALSFALVLTVSALGGRWLADVIRRKTRRDDG
ncbi:hypothetical protein [Streptomyces griseoflavus]|uniref:hypothetical protein n=1 Tax=Streptomyces griseoflavus TaxID=35619 RepID=UPI0033C6152A